MLRTCIAIAIICEARARDVEVGGCTLAFDILVFNPQCADSKVHSRHSRVAC